MPASPYTHARLSEAVAASRTLSEALLRLGVDPKSPTRSYLRTRMKSLGIDTSHFAREGARWTKETLEPAVTASTSMYEVLRHLDLDPVGGHHTHISRRIRALGIDTSHFVEKADSDGDARRRRPRSELLRRQDPADARRIPAKRLRRALLVRGTAERCALCDIGSTWRGRPLPLEVDHIDGNWRNNRLENLRLLCPNCHSTTDSYRGRNQGAQSPRAGMPQ
ncbi:HNH endonuclease signature motif containing protein [Streptomyces purpurogeneiscleroticus]|uniref:HNH endonuclease signature motif containing protein n=1 Tax=Streptomyces purpurogeneiscleroticus TaxID=68259 RepID=UPI001CBE97E3|nr:HNH endonuclease signature motif containing protein [Streptomyces purpurogeneiscleroticus]MBZ4018231.1 HNH endonuclease [Streptomyces purpurogeneiscleroticus]